MTKRNRRILWIAFFVILVLYGPTIIIPIGNPYRATVFYLREYVTEHGTLPPTESAFLDFLHDPCEYRDAFTPPFYIAYGVAPDDLEIRNNRIVYKSTGERCALISSGRNLFYDSLFSKRYNLVSIHLFMLMLSSNAEEPNR